MNSQQKPLIVIGAGGHAEILIALLQRLNREVVGITDVDDQQEGLLGVPMLGNDEVLRDYPPGQFDLVNGLGSAGQISTRASLYNQLIQQGYGFAQLTHPQSSLDPQITIGQGCQIMNATVIVHGAKLAENVLVNSRAVVEHHCRIGAHSHIASGAVLCGRCTVGEAVHIGAGATVIQNITIGDGAVIAAGAVVTKDVSAQYLVAGVPARWIRTLWFADSNDQSENDFQNDLKSDLPLDNLPFDDADDLL